MSPNDEEQDRGARSAAGEVARKTAHDLNNQLTIIDGNLQLLREDLKPQNDPDLDEILDDALSASRKAAELTARISSLAREIEALESISSRESAPSDEENLGGEPRKRSVPGGSETILVVDDDPRLRKLTSSYLRTLGYQVHVASNAQEAVRRLEDEESIDIVFSDVVMPGEMDGRGLAEYVRARWPRTRVRLTSGSLISVSEDQATGVLRKPYTVEQVARTIRDALDAPARPAPDSNVLSLVSHQLQTRLSVMHGLTKRLMTDDLGDEKRRELTRELNEQTHRLLSLVGDVLVRE